MTLTQITEKGIKDGEIVNADINASAAIAGSKISPVFGAQTITGAGGEFTGNVIVNGNNGVKIENTYPRIFLTDTNSNSDFSIINNNGTYTIYDDTNGANRLRIFDDGTVNIPGNLDAVGGLDVTGAITSTGNLTITNTQPKIFLTDSNNTSDFSIQNENGNLNLYDETNSASRIRIISTGNVGIGLTSPTARLHTSAPYNVTGAKITGGASGYSNALEVYNAGGTNLLTVQGTGNLLLGATSYQNGGFGGTSHGINIAGTQPQILLHETDTDKDGYFGLAGSILRIQTADSIPVTIWTNDTKRINVHETTGDTTIETGNLVIGTSGKGIDFSAAGNASGMSNELLDDYEEGTWTPFVGTQSGSDYTISSSYNCYTKIGNIVHAYFTYTFTAEGNGSISLFNLPFSADSNVALVGQGYVTSGSTRLSLQFIKYTANIVLPRVDDGVNYQNYWTSRGSWAPTNTFVCHITYKV